MKVLLIGLIVTAGVVLLFSYLSQLWKKKKGIVEEESNAEPMSECCGAHEVCEIDLLNKMSEEIFYYEDEDLDAYKNFEENDYNDAQIDEFRDVLYSLKENELEGWVRSLELRKIELPSVIKSELVFMMVRQ